MEYVERIRKVLTELEQGGRVKSFNADIKYFTYGATEGCSPEINKSILRLHKVFRQLEQYGGKIQETDTAALHKQQQEIEKAATDENGEIHLTTENLKDLFSLLPAKEETEAQAQQESTPVVHDEQAHDIIEEEVSEPEADEVEDSSPYLYNDIATTKGAYQDESTKGAYQNDRTKGAYQDDAQPDVVGVGQVQVEVAEQKRNEKPKRKWTALDYWLAF